MKFRGLAVGLVLLAGATSPAGQEEDEPTGNLEGRVRLVEGVALEPTRILNTTDPEICGEEQTLQDILLSEDRGIKNVIIALRNGVDVLDRTGQTVEPETLMLDNVECRFEPHAAAITTGSTVEAHNSDAVLHTTHLYGPREINFSLPLEGMSSSRVLESPGMYIVKCDVHGWMQAYIRVDDHPFHAVTDADGRFRIDGLPAGTYTLEVWHESLGPLERRFVIEADTSTAIEIEYSP